MELHADQRREGAGRPLEADVVHSRCGREADSLAEDVAEAGSQLIQQGRSKLFHWELL